MAEPSDSAGGDTASNVLHISDLPDGFLADVAKYLPTPSRAIFAVAMTAPSSSWREFNWGHRQPPSVTSKAIILTSDWGVLDFAEVERSLAKKLTDDDLGAILGCIEAAEASNWWVHFWSLRGEAALQVLARGVTFIKTLKLTGCVNIVGHGLEPLRRCTRLEQIDLSLVKQHESPEISTVGLGRGPLISARACIPILDSIISTEGNNLKHIQFPKKWRRRGTYVVVSDFLHKYNALLENRGLSCSRCTMRIENSESGFEYESGSQRYTCYKCTQHFCDTCRDEDGDPFLWYCFNCEKNYCSDCVEASDRGFCWCENPLCKECEKACDCCEDSVCAECVNVCECCGCAQCEHCAPYAKCENCPRVNCEECFDGNRYTVNHCDICGRTLCSDCRVGDCKEKGRHEC